MDMSAYEVPVLEAEARVYDLLRHLFLEGPTRDLLDALTTAGRNGPEWSGPLAEGLSMMADAALGADDARCLDLQAEFARLLVGPHEPPALPYASCHLSPSRSLMTDVTLAVRDDYLKAGLAVRRLNRIPDDHLGIELEFLYFLTTAALDAAESGDGETVLGKLAERRDFIESHYSRWAPRFAKLLMRSTEEPFFRGSGLLVKTTAEPDI